MILTVDPSIEGCGCALWKGPELYRAGYAPSVIKESSNLWRRVDDVGKALIDWLPRQALMFVQDVIVELPQTYGGRAAKGDANDLIVLGAVCGVVSQIGEGQAQFVRPHEWKGSAPKSVTEARVWDKLSADELARVDLPRDKRRRGDVFDAIGIGLWYLKR